MASGIIVAAAFMIFGTLVQSVYYNFFDKTEYLVQEVPFTVNHSVYEPCDTVRATFDRHSIINVAGVDVQELILIKTDKSIDSIVTLKRDSIIIKGDTEITILLTLPCNLDIGAYYWQGILSYEIHDVRKESVWHTEKFLVE